MAGTFITFEGPEGCGKSTQVELLRGRLTERGNTVLCTREPGGTAVGEAIRNILQHDAAGEMLSDRAELLLFNASRAQLMDYVICPALDRNEWVLCDRFTDSTVAYQGYARNMDLDVLHRVNNLAIQQRKPDLTLLLDMDVEISFQRLEGRYGSSGKAPDRFERESMSFHERVREGYLELAGSEPDRFRIIPADRSIEEVSEAIWNAVSEALLK